MAEATHSQMLAALNYAHQPDENAYVSGEDATGHPRQAPYAVLVSYVLLLGMGVRAVL